VDYGEIGDACIPSNNMNNVVAVAKQHEWDLTVIDSSTWLLQLRWVSTSDLVHNCGVEEHRKIITGYVCPQLTVCETETTEVIPCFYYAYQNEQFAVISMTDDAAMHFYVHGLTAACSDKPGVFTLYIETRTMVGPLRDMRIFRHNSSFAGVESGSVVNDYDYDDHSWYDVQTWHITAVDFDTSSLIYGDVQVSATRRRIAFTLGVSVSCAEYTPIITPAPAPADSDIKTDSDFTVFVIIEISLIITIISAMYTCACRL
jgi:hypothetical protein